MPEREACERRVYRLATLLTGDRVAAVRVIEEVLSSQPRLDRLDGAHMDRLTVLRSREVTPAILFGTDVPAATAEALARLTGQEREAWVLARVFRLPTREAARAMDCSVTASKRHLQRAEEALRADLGPQAAAADEHLRAFAVRLDLPAFHRHRRLAQHRRRLVAFVLGALVLGAAAVAGVLWWQGALPLS